jgi:sporulation protein YlmC with PRC-barrel domain
MAEARPFTIGSEVQCLDGQCGELKRVVVDPVKREVTHLVVEPSHREGLGRLVPLVLLDESSEGVRLRCTVEDFENLPFAEETDFLPGGSGYSDYAAHEAYFWPYYGLGGVVADSSAVMTRDTLPAGEVGIRRGESVHTTDGEIGKVQGLVVEPAHHHVTHVLLQEGHLWGRKQVAIPIGAVTTLERGISLNLTNQEVEDLPPVDVDDVQA